MKNYIPEILGALLVIAAGLLLGLQLLVRSGSWYSIAQAMSHETAISCLFVAAAGLLIGKYLGNLRE